jgi:hypothetical protein
MRLDGMQESRDSNSFHDFRRPLIVRALRRSKVRKKIAEYLFDISPSGSYTSEIAYHVKTTPTNVIGAVRGMNTRYRKEESLISLNIVEEINSVKDIRLYKITDFGKTILEEIKEKP